MSLLYGIVLLATIVWLIKKKEVYNPYEEALGNSGYYQSSFVSKETCTDQIYRSIEQLSGHKRILKNFRFEREILEGRKKHRRTRTVQEFCELLMIHEAGVFVINSADIEGNIRGNVTGRYWIQSYRDGFVNSCTNYIANPFMENKKAADMIRWLCRDIPKLQFYSIAVFGNRGFLETEGQLDENKWSVTMQGFPMMIADIIRMRRKYLRPDEVDLIYERLQKENLLQ